MSSRLTLPAHLCDAACRVLETSLPRQKVALTRAFADAWRQGQIAEVGHRRPPDRPNRPERPELKHPNDMPRRGKAGAAGKRAFVHAIAHIELNAIDLAWDIVCRYTGENMPRAFYDDWVGVALDEAEHFELLANRLRDLGAAYGDLPAHDGLWEAATTTKSDLLERLAVVPLILEARGLDTTPAAIDRLHQAGDTATAAIITKIGEEEIPHVAAGIRWFEFLCDRRQLPAIATFRRIAAEKYAGRLKPPFNLAARRQAGMDDAYYLECGA